MTRQVLGFDAPLGVGMRTQTAADSVRVVCAWANVCVNVVHHGSLLQTVDPSSPVVPMLKAQMRQEFHEDVDRLGRMTFASFQRQSADDLVQRYKVPVDAADAIMDIHGVWFRGEFAVLLMHVGPCLNLLCSVAQTSNRTRRKMLAVSACVSVSCTMSVSDAFL